MLLCWYDSRECVVIKLEIVQQTIEKIKVIHEKVKAYQSRQKSYHDRQRKSFEFQGGDHVFFRVTLVIDVG